MTMTREELIRRLEAVPPGVDLLIGTDHCGHGYLAWYNAAVDGPSTDIWDDHHA